MRLQETEENKETIKFQILLSNKSIGSVIGTNGSRIRYLCEISSAFIAASKKSEPHETIKERILTIEGGMNLKVEIHL